MIKKRHCAGTTFKITQGMRFPSTRLKGCAINFEAPAETSDAPPSKGTEVTPTDYNPTDETEEEDIEMDHEAHDASE